MTGCTAEACSKTMSYEQKIEADLQASILARVVAKMQDAQVAALNKQLEDAQKERDRGSKARGSGNRC